MFIVTFLIFSKGVWQTAAADNALILKHATVIDATGSAPQRNVTVVLTNDRIAAIASKVNERRYINAKIVDAPGKFLIPCLWDMHVHWYDEDYLPLFIANGVTGIRIMWGMPLHHEWRTEIKKGALLGPRLYIASAIVDGPNPVWPGSVVASNAIDGREAVRNAKADGADFVKVYSLLPRDAYFAIADEAKKEGIPFVGHVPMSITADEASVAGQASIEHLDGILNACSSRQTELLKSGQAMLAERQITNRPSGLMAEWRQENEMALDSYNPATANALFARLRQNHTWQCPTLTVLRLITIDGPQTNDTRLKYMPPDIRSDWSDTNHFRQKPPEFQAFGQKYFKKHLELVGAMQHAGVGILAGTDTGNPYCFPGFGLHDEMEFLVQAGLTPMEALRAATCNPARFMGRENELGTIEEGKLADLVLLDANPLEDISNARRINSVIYRGKLYSRHDLDEMLAKIEALARADSSRKN